MSHELRTPLDAIGRYAELLEMGIRGPVTAQQREDLARVQRSQRHLLGLINEVLNYARVATGAVRYESGDVGVAETLVAVETLVAPRLRAKGLSYRMGVASVPAPRERDPRPHGRRRGPGARASVGAASHRPCLSRAAGRITLGA